MKNKKLFAILTLICFMFTLMPVAALADNGVPATSGNWLDVADTSWYGTPRVSGSTKYYQLENAAQLAGFAKLVNEGYDFSAVSVVQLKGSVSIDLGGRAWTPIGTAEHPLNVKFDGNEGVIKNLTVTGGNDYAGLVGYSTAIVQRVKLENAYVSGGNYVGGIAGCINLPESDTTVDTDDAIRLNGYVGGNVSITGKDYVGGMAGYVNGAISWKTGRTDYHGVQGSSTSPAAITGENYVGGLVGMLASGSVMKNYNVSYSIVTGETNVSETVGLSTGATITSCSYDNVSTVVINTNISTAVTLNTNEKTNHTVSPETQTFSVKYKDTILNNYIKPTGEHNGEHCELLGWYAGDTKVIAADGTLIAGVSGYTNSSGGWIYDQTSLTLTAKWLNIAVDSVKISVNGTLLHGTTTIQEAVDWVYDQPQATSATTYDISIPAGTYTEDINVYMAKNAESVYSHATGGATNAAAAKRRHTYYRLIGAVDANGDPTTILNGSISVYSGSYQFRHWFPDCHAGVGIENIKFVAQANDAKLFYLPNKEPNTSASGRYQTNQTIKNCVFDGNGKYDVAAVSGPQSKQSLIDITIENCTANDVHDFVSFGSSVNVTIKGCQLTNVTTAIKGSNADNWKVENCTISNYENEGIRIQPMSIDGKTFEISGVTITGTDRSIVLEDNAPDNINITNSTFTVLTSEHEGENKSAVTVSNQNNPSFALVALSGSNISSWLGDQTITALNDAGYSENEFTIHKATNGTVTFDTATQTSYLMSYPFTVEHYKETSPGVYEKVEADTETRYAALSQTVNASPKTYDGFAYDETVTEAISSANMQTSGVILKCYYKNTSNGGGGYSGSYSGSSKTEQMILTIDKVRAWVFTRYIDNDVPPVLRNDRTMLPIRFVVENLGGTVDWDEDTRTVTIQKGNRNIQITIDAQYAKVNGKAVLLDSPAYIDQSRTYLPLRFVAENLGATVNWYAETQQVVIMK